MVCLYKSELTQSRYKFDARKAVEGRDMGLCVWEEVFEAQMATNEAMLDERDAMSIDGKVVIKTNKKNAPSAMELKNGEMVELSEGEFFEKISLTPDSMPQHQNMIDAWFVNMQREPVSLQCRHGRKAKAGTPFAAQAL